MMNEQQMHLVSRSRLTGALLLAAAALPACNGTGADFDEDVDEAQSAIGPVGTNDLGPYAVDSRPLKRATTNFFGITTPSNADPAQLCKSGTVSATSCTLRPAWKSWLDADATNRSEVMIAIAKCAVEPGFTIEVAGSEQSFAGQWGLYPDWKDGRLDGQDKRERMSSCILTLLNGNHEELLLCIIGPGGAPFSDGCADPYMDIREGGFFGDLFAAVPTAYVAGPDTADPVISGRACTSDQGSYCCAEDDLSCTRQVVLAGSILGSPDQGFANKRCNAALVDAGGNLYCPSFFSTREPGRSYTNVFTTFVPPPL